MIAIACRELGSCNGHWIASNMHATESVILLSRLEGGLWEHFGRRSTGARDLHPGALSTAEFIVVVRLLILWPPSGIDGDFLDARHTIGPARLLPSSIGEGRSVFGRLNLLDSAEHVVLKPPRSSFVKWIY